MTPEAVVSRLTAEFLAARSDEWIVSFYWFLYQHPALWQEPGHPRRPGRASSVEPIIRLEDGAQVAPFDASEAGQPRTCRGPPRRGSQRSGGPLRPSPTRVSS